MAARMICTCALLFLLSQCGLAQTPAPAEVPELIQAPTPKPAEALPDAGPKIDGPKIDGPKIDGQPATTDVFSATPAYSSPSAFVAAEYLLWWIRNGPSPTLLTTGNSTNNGIIAQPGVQPQPGGTPLFGSSNLSYGAMSGLRLGAGMNFGENNFFGIEAWGFYLPRSNVNFTSPSNILVAVPFLDAASGQENTLIVNQAGHLSGFATIHSDSTLWGGELNAVAHSIRTADRSFDLLVGFRSLGLDESLNITQQFTALNSGEFTVRNSPGSLPLIAAAGNSATTFDSFSTRNRFYGGQIGGRFGWNWNNFHLDLTGKVALGVTEATATINGFTTSNVAGANNPIPGGVFALPSNIGTYHQAPFSVVPEIGLKLSYAVTSFMNVNLGYNVLYWSSVARPGAQIDPVLNSKQIPTGGALFAAPLGPTEQLRPFFNFNDTAFWAQGVSVGVEFRY